MTVRTLLLLFLVVTLNAVPAITQLKPTSQPDPVMIKGAPSPFSAAEIILNSEAQSVIIGQPIKAQKEFKLERDQMAPQTGTKPTRYEREYQQTDNRNLKREGDSPNYYPYRSVQDYEAAEEVDELDILVSFCFVVVVACVVAGIIVACKRLKQQRESRRVQAAPRPVSQGPNNIHNIYNQIRYHQEAATYLRALASQEQFQPQPQPFNNGRLYPRQEQVAYDMSEAQHQPRKNYHNGSEANYSQNMYPRNYMPFRNESEISAIQVQGMSEAHQDYPRL